MAPPLLHGLPVPNTASTFLSSIASLSGAAEASPVNAATPTPPTMSLVEASLSLQGDHFSPAAFEAATGLTLAGQPKNEPRHIRGYMGFKVRDHKPGNAVLYAPDDYQGDGQLMWLLIMVERHAAALGEFGVTEGILHAKYDRVGRTDLWFGPELLGRIAALGVTFRITCADSPVRRKWPPRRHDPRL